MSLEHLVPESKKVLEEWQDRDKNKQWEFTLAKSEIIWTSE
jgi:hypothetical protein